MIRRPNGALISELAYVDQNVKLGAGSMVWHFACLTRGAEIGEGASVAPGACLDGSRIGARSILGHHVAMGPGFWVGDDVFIGPNSTIGNDSWPRADKAGFDPRRFDGTRWAVIIEDGATVCANAVVLPGVRIGAGAMVAAGAVAERDLPPRRLLTRKGEVRPITPDLEARKLKMRMRFASLLPLEEAA
jgi:acetyltransferase-like isoleucine patch superfamily enzyme